MLTQSKTSLCYISTYVFRTPKWYALLMTLVVTGQTSFGAVHYVDLNSPNPTAPYESWATAARVIQHAVDVAIAGDEVVVTNGTYATGAKIGGDSGTPSRVAVNKAITVRSVNGPGVTIIQGNQPSGIIGPGAIRCVYMGTNSVLSGFTLTKGGTEYTSSGESPRFRGGGVWCATGGSIVTNCILTDNAAMSGGGACGGTLYHCILTNNRAFVTGEMGMFYGGAGGGAYGSTLINCIVSANQAFAAGGGAYNCTLKNCTLCNNSVPGFENYYTHQWIGSGGGAADSTLLNCILYYNTARVSDPNYLGGTLRYCCTTPMPAAGEGNMSLDPRLVDPSVSDFRLRVDSPCVNAGNNSDVVLATDLDGNPRISGGRVDIGAYESINATPPVITVPPISQSVLAGGTVTFAVAATGSEPMSYQWHFNGTAISGATRASLFLEAVTTEASGVYSVTASNPGGSARAEAILAVWLRPGASYVWQSSPQPTFPYTSWETAAHVLQEAVDATLTGGTVFVTNGTYNAGGRAIGGPMTNRVLVNKAMTLLSMNGPGVTAIRGARAPGASDGFGIGAVRGAYLASGAILSGFTLSSGATQGPTAAAADQDGGGVWCESGSALLTNCILIDNWAYAVGGGARNGTLLNCAVSGNRARQGAGVSGATLTNCTLSRNSAQWYGGGAYASTLVNCLLSSNGAYGMFGHMYEGKGGGAFGGTLNNCTVVGNSGFSQGGVHSATLRNCIVYDSRYSFLPWGTNVNYENCTFSYSCTIPMPESGSGNITNQPQWMDFDSGNFRLRFDSPCIDAGNDAYAQGTDLDGKARILGRAVDMGAYEMLSPGSLPFQAWLQVYGLPTNGTADYIDTDRDGHNNWQEWRCQTDPLRAQSVLRLLSAAPVGRDVAVRWQSVAGVNYLLEASTDLGAPFSFRLASNNIPGQAETTTYIIPNAAFSPRWFFRVGVGPD